jgi:hypothetical protein
LAAHIPAWLTVRDGLVVDYATYDCYEPWGVA